MFTYFMYSSMYMLISNSLFVSPPPPLPIPFVMILFLFCKLACFIFLRFHTEGLSDDIRLSLCGLLILIISVVSMLLQMALFCSLLCLNSSPLYVHVCVHIYIYVHHIFFIHSSADGHLGCFYDLAIVSSATVNTKVLQSVLSLSRVRVFATP